MTISDEKKIDKFIYLLLDTWRNYDDYLIKKCFIDSGLSDVLYDYIDEYIRIHGAFNGYCDLGYDCPF